MKRRTKLLFLAIDVCAMVAALFLSFWLRFESFTEHSHLVYGIRLLTFSVPMTVAILWRMGLYNRTLLFTSLPDLIAVFQAVTLASMAKLFFIYFQWMTFSRAVLISDWVLNLLLIGFSRVSPRLLLALAEEPWVRRLLPGGIGVGKRTLIYGAGRAGESVARELRREGSLQARLIGFIDDDSAKVGQILHGLPILGFRKDLRALAQQYRVEEVIVAMSVASGETLRDISRACREAGVRARIIPGLEDLLGGKIARLQVRDIDVEDLLRRPPVRVDLEEIAAYVRGRRILVTGAGGSIGSEICRQILPFHPSTLILMGQGENSIYQIHQELLKHPDVNGCRLLPQVASIQDEKLLLRIFQESKPEIVFHAAAHKHVPLMEAQPCEAVKNNVFGTLHVLQAAQAFPPERFVMISTDKAVHPSSVMGATKRVAELLVKVFSQKLPTRCSVVRFGNVLGSRGSVIPLFQKQIEKGEAITITHPDMVRYFMTIPEASQLVIQAGALGKGGEIFLLDMGEPVRILDLAEDLIRLAGLEVGKDVRIEFSGTRPGEKLNEELLTAEEGKSSTRHPKIFVARSENVEETTVLPKIHTLLAAAEGREAERVLRLLGQLVEGFPYSLSEAANPGEAGGPGREIPGREISRVPESSSATSVGSPPKRLERR